MEEGSKKVSFGFSKSNKLTKLVRPPKIVKEKVELVDSFDGKKGKFSYQGVVREEVKKEPLVIPLIGTRSAYDVIKAKLKETGKIGDVEDKLNGDAYPVTVKEEKEEILAPAHEGEDVKPSLEALAAKEILASLNKNGDNEEGTDSGRVIVPDMDKPTFVGEKESTLEDYDNVPVGDYGLALLRGMGWTPQTGIGKESKIVAPITTKLRPKRLGLGAEGSLLPPGEQPPVKRGVFVQLMAGEHKGSVGVVEGTDGDTGSVVVKLAEVGNVSLSENFIKVVTKKEYEQFLNGNGHAADPPKEKKYGINEKDSQRSSEKTSAVRIKKEEPDSGIDEKRRREKKARSISRTPERKKRSRSRDKRDDGRDRGQDKGSKRDRSRSSSRRRERSRERRRRRSGSTDRREKKRKSSESDGELDKKKARKDRSLPRSPVKDRRERSKERRRKRDYSESGDEDRKTKSRKDSPSSKTRKDSEDSDQGESRHRRQRSRSTDRKEKKKKTSERSSSGEKYSKKKSRRKDHSDEERISKKDKKKKKKSKKSKKHSESTD